MGGDEVVTWWTRDVWPEDETHIDIEAINSLLKEVYEPYIIDYTNTPFTYLGIPRTDPPGRQPYTYGHSPIEGGLGEGNLLDRRIYPDGWHSLNERLDGVET